VNTRNCEHVRIALMASLDGESKPPSAEDQQHLSTCEPCGRWLAEMQSLTGQLHGLSYPAAPAELWPAVASQILGGEARQSLPRWIWPIAATVLGWRVLQLFVDLPLPVLHPLGQIAAVTVALWLVGRDLLTIEASAPELHKRGV
jgi:predicted anti-sigma-YlaC factor YlaD